MSTDRATYEHLLAEVARSARYEPDVSRFFSGFLTRGLDLCEARDAVVWLGSEPSRLEVMAQLHRDESWSAADLAQARQLTARWLPLIDAARVSLVRLDSTSADEASRRVGGARIVIPLQVAEQRRAIVEFLLSDPPSDDEATPLLDRAALLQAAAEQFLARQQPTREGSRQTNATQLDAFAQALHGSLDLTAVAFVAVNELRRLLECDRVTLVWREAAAPRVLAVSGQETVDRRAAVIRALEALCASAARYDEPIWQLESADDLPPEIQAALDEVLHLDSARGVIVWPLRLPRDLAAYEQSLQKSNSLELDKPAVGWFVIEHFQAATDAPLWRQQLEQLTPHAAQALDNAATHDRLPLRRLGELLRSFTLGRHGVRTLLAVAAIAALIATLLLVRTELQIEARGELQPVERRHIFAPIDGQVQEVEVEHGQSVKPGDTLVSLRRPELEFELTRVVGELQTTEKRLANLQAARLRDPPKSSSTTNEYQQRTAEEEELKQAAEGLRRQQTELLRQQQSLMVKSPQAGQILTWDVERLLAARPVQRGQLLLTVGRFDGPWRVELRVPEDRVGYILQAQAAQSEPLPVSYILATDPIVRFHSHVDQVATRSALDDPREPTVSLTAGADSVPKAGRRPGAAVIARVQCGRVPLAHAWFLDLVHYLRTHWWW